MRCTREGLTLSVTFITRYERPTLRTVERRPTYASNTSDGHQRETAAGGLRTISLYLTTDYRSNDRRPYLVFVVEAALNCQQNYYKGMMDNSTR